MLFLQRMGIVYVAVQYYSNEGMFLALLNVKSWLGHKINQFCCVILKIYKGWNSFSLKRIQSRKAIAEKIKI